MHSIRRWDRWEAGLGFNDLRRTTATIPFCINKLQSVLKAGFN
jgi:hypothetical protein